MHTDYKRTARSDTSLFPESGQPQGLCWQLLQDAGLLHDVPPLRDSSCSLRYVQAWPTHPVSGTASVPLVVLQVTIKAADQSINKDVRKALVAGFSRAVPEAVGQLPPDRLYMTFEDIPVQNFAVGDSIMTFDTMHT